MITLKRINPKNKHHVQYPNVPSTIRPISHGLDLPVPEQVGKMEHSSDSKHRDMTVIAGDDAYKSEGNDLPVPLTQAELNDQTRDLNLLRVCSAAQFTSQRETFVALETTFY